MEPEVRFIFADEHVHELIKSPLVGFEFLCPAECKDILEFSDEFASTLWLALDPNLLNFLG